MKATLERLRELLVYDPLSGSVSIRRNGRVLLPDHDGIVTVFDRTAKTKIKKYKLERLAFFLAFGNFPREDQRVLHKNLDTEDNRITNLSLVSRSVFKQIKEARKNLIGGIKIVPHVTDQFSYVLHWFEDGSEKTKTIQDIVVARKQLLRLQLKYSKILTKYCIFDRID